MIQKAIAIPAVKLPRPNHPAARRGLAYQRSFTKALRLTAPKDFQIFPEQWLSYWTKGATVSLICCPDIILVDTLERFAIVVEVKTTYTPLAFEKLQRLYCPVVSRAFNLPTKPLVVCKNLSVGCPRPNQTISFALISPEPLLNWIGRGPVIW
jgi:hypothetical protein